MTDGRDQGVIAVRVVDSEELRRPVIDHAVEVAFSDPLEVVELDFHFTGVVFSPPGEYRARLFAAGEFLMERRITLIQTPGGVP